MGLVLAPRMYGRRGGLQDFTGGNQSATDLTAGTITVTTFASGDRITFKVTAIGSSTAGKGVRFTLKGKV